MNKIFSVLVILILLSGCVPAEEKPQATLFLRYASAFRQNASALIEFEATGVDDCRSKTFAFVGSKGFVTVPPNEPGVVKGIVDCDSGKIEGELEIQIVEDNIEKIFFESQLNISSVETLNFPEEIQKFCESATIQGFYEFTYTFGNGEVKISTYEGRTDITVIGLPNSVNLSDSLDGSADEYAFMINSNSRNLDTTDFVFVCNGQLIPYKEKLYKIFEGDKNLITT